MNIFLLKGVGNINFFKNQEFNDNCDILFDDYGEVNVFGMNGVFFSLSEQEFLNILPMLNGMFDKYYFVDFGISPIDQNTILGKNIYSLEYNKEEIQGISDKIGNIQNELNSDKLITRSKKEEYYETLKESTYIITCHLVKTYFLINEAVENKKELEKVINSSNSPEDLKSQALLMDKVGFNKTNTLTYKFEVLSKQLNYFADIMEKYFRTYIKEND